MGGERRSLRRAFGGRWANRVKPVVLKELMRHKTVLTTEKYHVEIHAQETAAHLREVMAAEKIRGSYSAVGGATPYKVVIFSPNRPGWSGSMAL